MLLLLLLSFFASEAVGRELKFVQAIWRHGDRAPNKLPYPNDPYTEEFWPRGWGELTTDGMKQQNELGKWFRRRYDGFINSSYIPSQRGMRQMNELGRYFRLRYADFIDEIFNTEEAYMRSSDTDRALSSAQAFLSGMFPAPANMQWSPGNTWQPVPVHSTTPGENDWLCKSTSVDCPNYDVIYNPDEQKDSDTFTAMYADMFKMLAQENTTGNTNFTYADTNGLYDVTREIIHGLTELQPEWLFETWPQYNGRTTLDIGTELRWIRYINQWGTVQKGQFFGGFLLNDFITNAQLAAEGKRKDPDRMLWYSSHDTVLSSLMYTMGLGDGQMPPYAACFFMEVWADNGESFTEFYYKNTTDEPHGMAIPGCGLRCQVGKLAEVYKGVAIPTTDAASKNCGTKPCSDCSGGKPNSARPLGNTLVAILIIFYHLSG